MIRIPENGLLYHGSYVEVSTIDLSLCRDGLDFGKGFYLTSSLSQTVSYIPALLRKAKRRGLISEDAEETGVVSVFEYRPNPKLSARYFDEADAEWLHFVASNRDASLFPELRRQYAEIDVVGGKIANDQTAVTLNNYLAGAYGRPGDERADRIAVELLEPNRLKDQFCFRTDAAGASLRFVRSIRYEAAR